MEKLKVLDLFSGIGGFSLGLERTGGFETVAFCEIEKFPQAVLRKHWPEVPIFEDVITLNKDALDAVGIGPIDIITGGFPCQDLSVAGKQKGFDGETRSGLWSEIARLTCELRPRYVLVENVANLIAGPSDQPGKWLGRVLGDLAEIGYNAEWHCIPASYVGAWHRRDRVWILAYPNKINEECRAKGPILRQQHLSIKLSRSFKEWPGRPNLAESRFHRRGNGLSNISHRLGALGNSVVPQIPEIIGRAILEAETPQP